MLRLCLDACIWYQPKYATCAHDAVEQRRVDGVMEITLAATTTPSDVAIPASFISDLRAPRVRARQKIMNSNFVP